MNPSPSKGDSESDISLAVAEARASAPASTANSIALTVAYDGSGFAGFARQPGLQTVQGSIEAACATVMRRGVETTGAGRTDSGVHALGQVVSFEAVGGEPDAARLRRSLDALTPPGIVVREVRLARPGFSARFDATGREYRYRLIAGPVPPLFLARFAWHVGHGLDVEAMQSAAAALVGEHDFRSFCVTGSALGQRTVRRLDRVEVSREAHLGEECVTVRVVGNAFLHSMVRVIVGSLVDVGAGRRAPEWLAEALHARDRAAAGPTAPAQGLTLWRVEYPVDVWL